MNEFTHLGVTHPNGDQCIWLDGVGWFVPLDAGGEGYDCPHQHPCAHSTEAVEKALSLHADCWPDCPCSELALEIRKGLGR